MRIQRFFPNNSRRSDTQRRRANLAASEIPLQQNVTPIFEDYHHDLLYPAPLSPPTVDEDDVGYDNEADLPMPIVVEDGESSPPTTPFDDTASIDAFPDLLPTSPPDDTLLRLSRDLERSTPPARNPQFVHSSATSSLSVNTSGTGDVSRGTLPSVSPEDVTTISSVSKGFPPSPNDDIPLVTATMVQDIDDPRHRANTFPPSCYEYSTSTATDATVASIDPSQVHCVFIPSASQVEHVVVDESEQGFTTGASSRSSSSRLQLSDALPPSVQNVLWKTGRLSKSACDKTIRIARQHLTKSNLKKVAQQSAKLAQQTSRKVAKSQCWATVKNQLAVGWDSASSSMSKRSSRIASFSCNRS